MSDNLKELALKYHRADPPGKLTIAPTKPMATQHDLTLAYSPGVAAACEEIVRDSTEAATVTARGNLVGVVTNGTAVLGLGSIGALASKPVMEGKAVLFKKFSGIDVFDIEVEERDPEKFVDIVAGLEATFGGINLEDVKAPECFVIEKALRERMNIPVFHDDQHGTAIVTAAAVTSALKVVGKQFDAVRLVCSGAGAAALACLDLLVSLGLRKENVTVIDRDGVVYTDRKSDMDEYKARYARDTEWRSLDDAIEGADVFLGLSAPGVLSGDNVKKMGTRPIILALANPDPEILPEVAKAARPDAIVATGRSDYPNQVNNVLCFPFIFRGALDVGATTINEEMKMACVNALSRLAESRPSDVVRKAYGSESLTFGPEYLIPKPFDPRLITTVAPAVALAAMNSGVATRPIQDFEDYAGQLEKLVYRSSTVMEPFFDRASQDVQRVCFAEGEDERVVQAAQHAIDHSLAHPILVGRRNVIEARIEEMGLSMRPGVDFELADPGDDDRFDEIWREYFRLMGRRGVSQAGAQYIVRNRNTAFSSLLLRLGYTDALIVGSVGRFEEHLDRIRTIIGKSPDVHDFSTLVGLILPTGTFFVCDTHITPEPDSEELAEMTMLAASEIRRFGIEPKIALVSHSNFGTRNTESATRMHNALAIIKERAPNLEIDGEMHADAALSETIRNFAFPDSDLKGNANLLVMPNLDAAHSLYTTLKVVSGGVQVGPILLGAPYPVHIVTQAISVRGLVNMTAVAAVESQEVTRKSS